MSCASARNRTCRLCEVNGRSDPLLADREGDALGSSGALPKSNEKSNVTLLLLS